MARKIPFKRGQADTELAYLAGIIDGEGCFFIGQMPYKDKKHWHVFIKITSCDVCLIDWLKEHFTGCSERRNRWTSKKAFYRPVYSWTMGGETLDYFLPLLEPYFIIKKEHCIVMKEIRKTFNKGNPVKLTSNVLEKRITLLKEMRKLNSRFHNHAIKQ